MRKVVKYKQLQFTTLKVELKGEAYLLKYGGNKGGEIMNPVQKILQEITHEKRVEKVLEVGIGKGDFLKVLVDTFDENVQMIGVDKVGIYLEFAEETFDKNKNVSFIEMDAEKLKFEDDSFDMVFISNTLHHLPKVEKVLREMKRVVKPNGYVVIHEMICDDQTPKQNVHVWLHHLSAEIDTHLGNYHGLTYRKNEIKDLMSEFGLETKEEMTYIIETEESEKEIIDHVLEAINKRILEIQDQELRTEFKQRLEGKIEQLYEIGFTLATEYVAVLGVNESGAE